MEVKVAPKEEFHREYSPVFSQNFPYELTPDYKNPGLIGKGGFARVFRANRTKDEKEVAVKIPISVDKSIGKSFIKELKKSLPVKDEIYSF